MERSVMGELNMYRGAGAKPNFSDIARRHGMDRHTVARYWSEGADPPRIGGRRGRAPSSASGTSPRRRRRCPG